MLCTYLIIFIHCYVFSIPRAPGKRSGDPRVSSSGAFMKEPTQSWYLAMKQLSHPNSPSRWSIWAAKELTIANETGFERVDFSCFLFSLATYIYIYYILVKILNASKCKLNSFDRSIVVKKNALVNTHCTGCWVKLICRLNISFCLLGVPLAEGHADGLGRPHQPYGQPSSENMWKSFHIKLVKDALHLKQN